MKAHHWLNDNLGQAAKARRAETVADWVTGLGVLALFLVLVEGVLRMMGW